VVHPKEGLPRSSLFMDLSKLCFHDSVSGGTIGNKKIDKLGQAEQREASGCAAGGDKIHRGRRISCGRLGSNNLGQGLSS
jgi:hypothetical protein